MSQHYFAQVSPGLEGVLKAELKQFGARKLKVEEGGVSFQGTRKHLYRTLQQSRIANLVYWTVSEGTAPNHHALFERAMKIAWKEIIPASDHALKLSIRVSLSRHPEFQGTGQVESLIFRAIESSLESHRTVRSAQWSEEDQAHQLRILVRVQDHRVSIRLDTAGRLLHKRGWRMTEGEAPLRPTLAAAMLHLLNWKPDEALIDPMCGSGTFSIEASLMAAQASPRLWSHYTCHAWLGFDLSLWEAESLKTLNEKTAHLAHSPVYHPHIYASDQSQEAIALTQQHLQKAGQMVQVSQADIFDLLPPQEHTSGLILVNPPYGLRVSEGEETKGLLRRFASQPQFKEWRLGLIYPRQLTPPVPQGLISRELARFQHGGLPVWVWEFSQL